MWIYVIGGILITVTVYELFIYSNNKKLVVSSLTWSLHLLSIKTDQPPIQTVKKTSGSKMQACASLVLRPCNQ